MSEYLLLSVYTRYLETRGYRVERRVKLERGAGTVDLVARKKGEKTVVAEARWIRNEGDLFEVLARCIMNRRGYPRMRHILVLEKSATSEEIIQIVLDRCYEHRIELHFIDINNRAVFENILTVQVFPAIRSLLKSAKQVLKNKLSAPQKQVLSKVLQPLAEIEGPPSLVADVRPLLRRLESTD